MSIPPTDPSADFDTVPVIDIGGMIGGHAEAKAAVAKDMREACIKVGFFYIANHGVPQELIAQMFGQGPRFFGLPLDEKMRIHVTTSPHYLGYIGMEDENADPAVSKGDLHEAFDFVPPDLIVDGQTIEGDFRHVGNLWPDSLPDFRDAFMRYGVAMKRLSRTLFQTFALALDLPEDYFRPMTDKAMTLIRILHYPSQPGPLDVSRLGVGAHTDHECFTILSQDEVPALQVRNRRGDWIDAPRIPGTFVVNIGDQMARWTNGLFTSTFHRVANLSGRTRYSVPCFVGANADAVVEALPSCVGPDNPPKFPPIVAGEYVSTLIYHNFQKQEGKHPLKQGMAVP